MSPIERLKEEIDNPSLLLQALADAHEEQGDDVIAEGYRWLAREGRWPVNTRGFWHWDGHRKMLHKNRASLREEMPLCYGGVCGSTVVGHRTASAALFDAALGIAWHRKGVIVTGADTRFVRGTFGGPFSPIGTLTNAGGWHTSWTATTPDGRTLSLRGYALNVRPVAVSWLLLHAPPLPMKSA